jgi:hypothetical protein
VKKKTKLGEGGSSGIGKSPPDQSSGESQIALSGNTSDRDISEDSQEGSRGLEPFSFAFRMFRNNWSGSP